MRNFQMFIFVENFSKSEDRSKIVLCLFQCYLFISSEIRDQNKNINVKWEPSSVLNDASFLTSQTKKRDLLIWVPSSVFTRDKIETQDLTMLFFTYKLLIALTWKYVFFLCFSCMFWTYRYYYFDIFGLMIKMLLFLLTKIHI